MKRQLILLAWYRHWRTFWFYHWNWAWALYAGRGTTDQQRHCCIHCSRQLTWSRCEDPWWCICCSNAVPQDIKHFPGLQQQHLLVLHFWTTSECSTVGYCLGRLFHRQLEGWDKKQMGPWSTFVRCYLWHYYLPPGRASWRMVRKELLFFPFFSKKFKILKFHTQYLSPLAVNAWSHHPQK